MSDINSILPLKISYFKLIILFLIVAFGNLFIGIILLILWSNNQNLPFYSVPFASILMISISIVLIFIILKIPYKVILFDKKIEFLRLVGLYSIEYLKSEISYFGLNDWIEKLDYNNLKGNLPQSKKQFIILKLKNHKIPNMNFISIRKGTTEYDLKTIDTFLRRHFNDT